MYKTEQLSDRKQSQLSDSWLWVMTVSEVNCENFVDKERSSQKFQIAMDKRRQLKLTLAIPSIIANKTNDPGAGYFC